MTSFVSTHNVAAAEKFQIFKSRDIFFHDGKTLRRLNVSGGVQAAAAFIAAFLLVLSVFAAAQLAHLATATDTRVDVARMQRQLADMEADVGLIKQIAQERYQLTSREVTRLGLAPSRFQGTGGPFEAVEPLKTADPKFKALFTSWKKLDQLEHATIAIPSAMPVTGANLTSTFGVRSDPFRHRAAMHTGMDLAGATGTPIHATADGVVDRSEWVNGYGNLVEIDHGRGIQTRYGHLSRSLVTAGQHIKRGDVIALMGSTGRSTGSHLHYEVRIDGRAVNPAPFMRANEYLLAVQRRAALSNGAQLAMGGPAED